jgi:hypothetical protein
MVAELTVMPTALPFIRTTHWPTAVDPVSVLSNNTEMTRWFSVSCRGSVALFTTVAVCPKTEVDVNTAAASQRIKARLENLPITLFKAVELTVRRYTERHEL